MLGEELKKMRERCGFSQEDVARALGTTQQTIQRIETGKSPHSGYIESMEAFLKATSAGKEYIESTPENLEDGGPYASRIIGWSNKVKILNEKLSRSSWVKADQDLVPVLGMDNVLDDKVRLNYTAINYIQRSEPIKYSQNPYAIKIAGNDMYPSLKQSEIAIVNPDLAPMIEEPHIFLYKQIEDNYLRAIVANLEGFDSKTWRLAKFHPHLEYDIERSDYPVCHRIVGRFSVR